MDTKVFPALPLDGAAPFATNEGATVLAPVAAWPIAGSGVWGVHTWNEQTINSQRGWSEPVAYIVRHGNAGDPCWVGVLPGAPGGDQDDAMHFAPQETPEEAFSLILAEIDI